MVAAKISVSMGFVFEIVFSEMKCIKNYESSKLVGKVLYALKVFFQ